MLILVYFKLFIDPFVEFDVWMMGLLWGVSVLSKATGPGIEPPTVQFLEDCFYQMSHTATQKETRSDPDFLSSTGCEVEIMCKIPTTGLVNLFLFFYFYS